MGRRVKVAAGAAALVGVAMLAGCQCAPPVGEYMETRTEVDVSKNMCVPAKVTSSPVKVTNTVTVIRRMGEACPSLPPVSEITVGTNPCTRTKMVFVTVRPTDDRCFNVESRNFERPWPWGPYGMGNCCP